MDDCEPPCGCWELNRGPLEEQPVLLTAKPSSYFFCVYTFVCEEGACMYICLCKGMHAGGACMFMCVCMCMWVVHVLYGGICVYVCVCVCERESA